MKITAMCALFGTGAGRSLDLHSSSKVFGKLSNSMQTEVTATAAGGRVHDAFKALMYVVWLSCIDRELLE